MFEDLLNKLQTSDKLYFLNTLNDISDSYYSSSKTPLTDEQFDYLVSLYEGKFNEEYSYIGSKGKCKLPCYMPSLNKAKDNHALSLFNTRCNDNKYIVTDKIDGYSLLMVFKKGENIKLYNRGDGEFGTDITHIYKYIDKGNINIGKIEKLKDTLYVRGELVMYNDTFKKYSKQYNNPRNLVAGVINAKDTDKNILKDITFIAYGLPTYKLDTTINVFDTLKTLGFYIPNIEEITSKQVCKDYLESLLIKRKEQAPFDIDGLVITSYKLKVENSIENPKYNIAFKMLGDTTEAKVVEVEWNLSKTNALKPRIKIEPVILNGVTIKNLTGFNAKYIVDNNIGPNTILLITRSGDVIPHILEVLTPTKAFLPNLNFHWSSSGVDIISDDDNTREAFIHRMISLFTECDVKGMKEGVLNKLYESGIVNEHLLFNCTKEKLLLVEGVKDKSATNILESISALKTKVTLVSLMVGSCMFVGIGNKKISKILNNVIDIQDFILKDKILDRNDIVNKIKGLDGFNKTADTFYDYLLSFKEYYEDVKDIFMLHYETIEEPKEQGKFTNMSFCFSGVRDKAIEEYIKNNGGTIDGSLSKTTKVLVVLTKDGTSSKIEKALKYNTNIITIEEMKEKCK
jgi:DNA ligase (NAD+)